MTLQCSRADVPFWFSAKFFVTLQLMNVDLFIARRISAGNDSGRTSPAVKVAIASVALSITIMILAVSIVGGFRREIINKVAGLNSHLSLYLSGDEEGLLDFTPELSQTIRTTPHVTAADLSVSLPVLLKTPDTFKGLYLKSIASGSDTTFLHSILTEGSLPRPDSRELLISRGVASHMKVNAGDSLNLFVVADAVTGRRMRVAGIYDSHLENFDDYTVYASLPFAQGLVKADSAQGSGIEISVDDIENIPQVSSNLIDRLNDALLKGDLRQNYSIDTLMGRGANYFAWLDMLDVNVWIILTLMTVVALFTLISGVLIIILEKVRFIGVMRAVGASSGRMGRVFVLLALRIAAKGMLIGNLAALAIVVAQSLWHFLPLNPEAYYIDFVPVSLNVVLWLLINAAFIVIIYGVLLIPARFVSKISPSESMRFEH